MVRPRAGRRASRFEHDGAFWASLHEPDVDALEPPTASSAPTTPAWIASPRRSRAIVDAKSPYTASHSAGVAEIAEALAATMGSTPDRGALRRAGLLHDVGKLGVSNRILDKPGKLDAEEWGAMRRHPELSRVILQRVPALADVAHLAGTHHERLDGSGYPDGLTAAELDLPARILQVADVAEALSAERPYRAALPIDEVLSIIGRDAGERLDALLRRARGVAAGPRRVLAAAA